MTTNRFGRAARRVFYITAAVLVARASFATEAKSDLSVELRVVDTVVSRGALGKPAAGFARIEVVIDSFREARDVVLRLERPDGRRLELRPDWSDARGRRVTPGERGIVIPARGRILTRIEVPLEGAALHPVVVQATTEEASAEGFVLVPLGVPKKNYVESDGLANFGIEGVN